MADKTEKFKEKKKAYLAAIKERGKALTRALKGHNDDLNAYQSFIDKEEAARKTYYAAAEGLQKSLTKTR